MEYGYCETLAAGIALGGSFPGYDDEEARIFITSHSSELVGLLEEAGLAEVLAREVADSEVNPEVSVDEAILFPNTPIHVRPASEDPADLHRRMLNSWEQAKALLVRWMHHHYILVQEVTDRDPRRPVNVYDHLADGGPPADWRTLLFCRLYRPYNDLPDPIAEAFEEAIADERARPDEATWRRYLGWLLHQTIIDLLKVVACEASNLEDELTPRIRELTSDGHRSRRRRRAPDAPAHGTLRHKIEGIIELSDDIADIQKCLEWIREALDVLCTDFLSPDRSPDETLAEEVAAAAVPGEPIPSRWTIFEHDEDFEEAIFQSLDDWMDWPDGEARGRYETLMERAKAGEFLR
jgi:hypothetical protein